MKKIDQFVDVYAKLFILERLIAARIFSVIYHKLSCKTVIYPYLYIAIIVHIYNIVVSDIIQVN